MTGKRNPVTTNTINVLRILARYDHGVTLSTMENLCHLDRRSIHSGAQAALRNEYVTRECGIKHRHFYKLTDLGRAALAQYEAQQAARHPTGALIERPIRERRDRHPRRVAPLRFKS